MAGADTYFIRISNYSGDIAASMAVAASPSNQYITQFLMGIGEGNIQIANPHLGPATHYKEVVLFLEGPLSVPL